MKKYIENIIEKYEPDRCSNLDNSTKSKIDICHIEGSYSLLKVTENYAQYAPPFFDMAQNLF
ncbi:MAG: hypothetical protein U9R34_03355 [Nanoarchaeota archaeon]|nr:hypothetical protein [Nanoarchaeota archaeon]